MKGILLTAALVCLCTVAEDMFAKEAVTRASRQATHQTGQRERVKARRRPSKDQPVTVAEKAAHVVPGRLSKPDVARSIDLLRTNGPTARLQQNRALTALAKQPAVKTQIKREFGRRAATQV